MPGLGGRGTLDAVLLSETGRHGDIVGRLVEVGFTEVPYGAVQPALATSVHFAGRQYAVLLYLLPETNELVGGWLAFRDFMSQHPDEVERYAAIKWAAILQGKTQPWTYQQAKTPYLTELAERTGRQTDPLDRRESMPHNT